MQRQLKLEEHAAVEVGVLYPRMLPFQMHPGGRLGIVSSNTPVTLNPKLFAAFSHEALSKMDFLPLTAEHVTLSAFGYPNGPTSFFRHDPPPVVE